MSNIYAVRAAPVRDLAMSIVGWVRVDPFADGTRPTDMVYLRDGSAHGQNEAMERVTRDPDLLYPTESEAVEAGIAKLRAAAAVGASRRLRRSKARR